MKSHARVVVIGGGAMGVGVLYHLVKEGWNDVVLCEKGELTSGSTWHAAGLVPHFIGSLNMAKIHAYGADLYRTIEQETGQATGWHGCGAIRLALNKDEVDWFHYVQGILNYIGVESHLIGPNEIGALNPLIDTKGVMLGFYTPNDGHTDPSSSTNAMAIGARNGGAEIYRHNRVVDINLRPGGEWEVVTEKGTIVAEHVVNATGSFGPQVGAMVGLKVPIANMIHQYLVTENLDEVEALDNEPPVVRDPRSSCYYRQEQQGILIGPYEMDGAEAWGLDGIDWSFDMELLPPDIDRLATSLDWAMKRIPVFEKAGIKRIVSGPITHTPDGNFLLGPAPGLRNHWMCCGASIGVCQGPGAGKYLAQWMVHGQTEINTLEFDPRRYGDWAVGQYCVDKSIDEYQQMYQVRLPGEYREAGRPVKTTPIYEKLKAQGAQFAEVFGWERAKWFALNGEQEKHSFRRSNWFDAVAEECKAVRERVGLLDLSSFAKYDVSGEDAEGFLDRLCANRIPKRNGGIVLTQMLGELGGIECEATITRLAEGHYYVLSGAVAEFHDLDWMHQHINDGEDVTITNVTADYGVLVLSGPRSRDVLSKLTNADLSNEAFPWLCGKQINIAGVPTRALRISYVGELGWELHHPMEQMEKLYDAVMAAGEEYGIANFGTYAVNAMRMEKAYRAWGGELTTEVGLLEADMERFGNVNKGDFIGREALIDRKQQGIDLKLVYCSVDTVDVDPQGNEPVYDGDRVIGITTGGAYGHSVGKTLAFAYVEPEYAQAGKQFDVLLLSDRRTAIVLSEPAYDPDNERLRA
ncbi:MAG: FAD-dependent oxidoreductase [Gammaproteobacteria bacterium]|nr:FAD-dependent oxidoreductase [Gammaproteobacteria bacterium]